MTLAPWNVLASGKFLFDAEEEKRKRTADTERAGFGGKDWRKWKESKQGS